MTGIVRDKVRKSFSSHADGYDDYAVVQKRVVARFLERYCDHSRQPAKLLDVGAGTGRLLAALGNCYPQAMLHGADLAYGMAKRGKAQSAKLLIACSDAEQLPFRNNSFELVVSTSTYQWLENLDNAFAEAYRVLLPGGRFCFALFGGETLYELRSSYRVALTESVGLLPDRSHTFFSLQEVLAALQMTGFAETTVECEREVEYYSTAKEVLAAIKGVGAGSAAKEQGRGLSGRKVIERMISHYEQQYGSAEGIPATYDVFYGTGVKP